MRRIGIDVIFIALQVLNFTIWNPSEVFDLKPTRHRSGQRRFCGVIIDVQKLWIGSRDQSRHRHLAFSLRNTGEYPALSDPVIMIGSIPLWG